MHSKLRDHKGLTCSETHFSVWGKVLSWSFCKREVLDRPPRKQGPHGEKGDVLGLELPARFGAGSSYLNALHQFTRYVLWPAGCSEAVSPGLILQVPGALGRSGELPHPDFSPQPEAAELDSQSLQEVNVLGGILQQPLVPVTPFLLRCGWQSPFSGSTNHFQLLILFFNCHNRSSTSFTQLFWVGVVIVEALLTMVKKTAAWFFFFLVKIQSAFSSAHVVWQ